MRCLLFLAVLTACNEEPELVLPSTRVAEPERPIVDEPLPPPPVHEVAQPEPEPEPEPVRVAVAEPERLEEGSPDELQGPINESASAMDEGGTDDAPVAVVRRCRYDQRCIIAALEGRTDSAQALGILAEAHKATGDEAAHQRAVRTVQRLYPNSAVARMYR